MRWRLASCLVLCLLAGTVLAEDDEEDPASARRNEAESILSRDGAYDPMRSRVFVEGRRDGPYTLPPGRLEEIRMELLYPYFDHDTQGGTGDLEENINTQNTQVNKQLTFLLPYFGFGLNYTWVSLNGYLGFSNAPFNWDSYPLTFPTPKWPNKPDPSFIGPFYSKCNIGAQRPGDTETDDRKPGVYWRLERDLPTRQDQFGIEVRERLMWDIREGMVGAEIFTPKHAIIVTWKNVTFAGGSVNTDAKYVTNTFQLVVATDEIRTYALFNYEHMAWTSHTEAGGSTDDGQGGVPAYVGFNAGNGTRSYEYYPYSQTLYIRDLATAGNVNNMPGRHIFRIDEKVLSGTCTRELDLKDYPLTFSPEHGNMMGGTLVNVTGPCFDLVKGNRITCQFDATSVDGVVLSNNRAACIMPRLLVSGYVKLGISVDGGPYRFKGNFFVETPLTAPEGVWFRENNYLQHSPISMEMEWLAGNLTQNKDAQVIISLWGYRERSITPEIIYIDTLVEGTQNTGYYTIVPEDYANRQNDDLLDLEMGLIMINLTIPEPEFGLDTTTVVWSRPLPLAWYFRFQWVNLYGISWMSQMCDRWIENDRNLRNFAYEVQRCPCLMKQAVADRGRFLPDFACDREGNTECTDHFGAIHCVTTSLPNKDGAGGQCCYDRDGYLMMTADKMWGGRPLRAHNLGKTPFDEANKVPSLSHWYHDVIPFYTCCRWQGEQSPGCVTYRFERRASQDCVGYQPTTAATVFGDPHIYTFDDNEYTFNGKGEFVLTRVDDVRHVLDIQGRFEAIEQNYLGEIKGSMLTSVAARDNISSIIEVRRRPHDAMWRYHLDVLVDGMPIYFDRYSQKIQQFRECVVYTPSNILNQSHVVVMFSSGAGVEVVENKGFLATRVYLPLDFANITTGLFGNWTFDPEDDFVLPDGSQGPTVDPNNLQVIHDEFALKWVLDDKENDLVGKSLFHHDATRSANYFYDANFEPEWNQRPDLQENATTPMSEIDQVCGESYQCRFDYIVTLRRDFAVMTKYYQDQFVNIKGDGLKAVTSCGALPTPPNGRKSTFNFLSGAEVKFDCDPGYVLLGEQRRWCYASGDWNWPEDGEATCVTEAEFLAMQSGITAGTVLAVLLPLLIAVLCYASHHRSKKRRYIPTPTRPGRNSLSFKPTEDTIDIRPQKNSSDNSPEIAKMEMMLPHEPRIIHNKLQNMASTSSVESKDSEDTSSRKSSKDSKASSDGFTASDSGRSTLPSHSTRGSNHSNRVNNSRRKMSIPTSFDGDYDTNEPLNDKPVVFQNVLWDLDVNGSRPPSRSEVHVSRTPPLVDAHVSITPPLVDGTHSSGVSSRTPSRQSAV